MFNLIKKMWKRRICLRVYTWQCHVDDRTLCVAEVAWRWRRLHILYLLTCILIEYIALLIIGREIINPLTLRTLYTCQSLQFLPCGTKNHPFNICRTRGELWSVGWKCDQITCVDVMEERSTGSNNQHVRLNSLKWMNRDRRSYPILN